MNGIRILVKKKNSRQEHRDKNLKKAAEGNVRGKMEKLFGRLPVV